MMTQLLKRLAIAAGAAGMLSPLAAASQTPQPAAVLDHRYAAGEHFVYDARTVVNSARLKFKRPGRYTVDVDQHDASKLLLRIEHEGKVNPPIAISVKPDGTWARPDGRAVPAFVSYDANSMCKHPVTAVRAGQSWDCHVDGVAQYLGFTPPEAGDVHVSVAKVVAPATAELTISFRGQPHRNTIVDEDTHNDVEVAQQSIRMSDVILENGLVTSIADHTQIGTSFGSGSPSVMDVVATKNLVEHHSK